MALAPTWPLLSLAFTVEGVPKPLARPRFSAGHVYNPSAQDLKRFRKAAAPSCPFPEPPGGPLEVTVEFVMVRPQSHRRANGQLKPSAPPTHQSTPDVDNLSKLVLDALNGLFYADDRQIWGLSARKRYAAPGELAATHVSMRYGLEGAADWPVAPSAAVAPAPEPDRAPAAPPENNVGLDSN